MAKAKPNTEQEWKDVLQNLTISNGPVKRRRATSWKALVAQARRSDLHEILQLWGDTPLTTPARAIEVDWLHVLSVAFADCLEACRMTAPEEAAHARRKLRRELALIHVAAEEWAKRA